MSDPTRLPVAEPVAYRLHFPPLCEDCRACAFPCDEAGRVDLDALGHRARDLYLYARALIGRRYAKPTVRVSVPG
jgi:hypothetical protein